MITEVFDHAERKAHRQKAENKRGEKNVQLFGFMDKIISMAGT